MKKYLLLVVIMILVLFSACDYLDQVPEKDIETIETVFERRSGAHAWLTSAAKGLTIGYFTNFNYNVAIAGADEFVAGDYARDRYYGASFDIPDGLQMSQSPKGNIWKAMYEYIRLLNTFIEHIDDVYDMETVEKANWKAEAKAIKAFYYFELVRRYGPIVLVPKNIGVNVELEKMRVPRSHVDTCFNEIIRLLDEAIPDLLRGTEREASHKLFLSKEGATAFKARVLLYAASPLFNGNEFYKDFKGKQGEPLFSVEYDPEKWKRAAEAADVAIELCESLGYQLIQGEQTKSTDLLNVMRDVEMSVWEKNYDGVEGIFICSQEQVMESYAIPLLPCFPYGDPDCETSVEGSVGPSMRMVEMFYTRHGLPIDMDEEWDYETRYQLGKELSIDYQGVVALEKDVLKLHLRREPRFYASIAADRCYWQRGPSADKNLLVEAYRGEKFGLQKSYIVSSDPQNICGYWVKKFILSEAATRGYSRNIRTAGDCRTVLIRLAELYLIQAEAWNEYAGPSPKVYEAINKVRRRAGIPDVEVAWRQYSKQPQKVETKEGMRDIIRQENAIEFAFEGHRFWDLRRWKIAHETLNEKIRGWNVVGETAQKFYNNYEGPIIVWNKMKFVAPRDYLFPLKAEEVMISGYVQNPGW